jgi:hypothetical protein
MIIITISPNRISFNTSTENFNAVYTVGMKILKTIKGYAYLDKEEMNASEKNYKNISIKNSCLQKKTDHLLGRQNPKEFRQYKPEEESLGRPRKRWTL